MNPPATKLVALPTGDGTETSERLLGAALRSRGTERKADARPRIGARQAFAGGPPTAPDPQGRAGRMTRASRRLLQPRQEPDSGAALVLTTRAQLAELVREAVAQAFAEPSTRPMERDVVGPIEMARRLDISRTTLHRMRVAGCPAVRLGDVFKFEPAAVLEWLKSRGSR